MEIRPERPGDEPAIRALTDAAFGADGDESAIIDRLRVSDRWIPALSLVALDDADVIVGHCVTSRGDLVADDGSVRPILTLGPISVAPNRQGIGIGGALIAATMAVATEDGWPLIVLVGHSDYYPRFGFERASPLGLVAPDDWLDIAWMARRLPAWTTDLRGRVRYPEAFGIAP